MEGSHGSQVASRFRIFGNEVSDPAWGSAHDRELYNVSIASQAARAYPNGTRSLASDDSVMFDTSVVGSNRHFQSVFPSGGLSMYDEQSLASAFWDMTFNTRTADPSTSHRNAELTNGHYPPGRVDVTLNQQRAPATRQDVSLPLQFSVANGKQKYDVEHQEQACGYPQYLGNFSRSSGLYNFDDDSFGVPFHPSTASASPFQQKCYFGGQSQTYTHHDQNVGSNMNQQDMGLHPYSVIQPRYTFPQMQQISGLDRTNELAALCPPPKGLSSYIGGGAFQNRNNSMSCDVHHFAYGKGHQIPSTLKTGVCKPHSVSSENQSYFLQKVLTEGNQEDVDKIFSETIDNISELMVDPAAHYLVQKIFEKCTNDQRTQIIREITKSPEKFLKVSCDMHGTHVVQRVIETVNTSDQISMVMSALSTVVMRLMTDVNGSHVLYCYLQKFSPDHKAFLLETAASRCLQLARDRNGCFFLQKCIQDSNEEQRNIVLSKISSNALRLSEDQYGNYVVQFILSFEIEWVTTRIVDELSCHFGHLSMQKFGSHVVEQCLKLAPPLLCDRIINELMNDPKLVYIMLDQYGNYVIQTALKQCQGEQHIAFVEAIRPHTVVLQRNMYGKRVLSKTYLKNKHYRFGFY
ncbi:hypothetical protein U9M48_002135 [Paspalum notatum var. saurae]|uniref:PUM-HD domain-containing protein n=1 Tax=Paspalum notatum var. saurae TaxID=547442 RepID=A0AAQ3PJ12_PASNO